MQDKFYLTEKLPPYIFAAIHKLKEEESAKGNQILDFGMGNPDLSPPENVLKKLSELSRDPTLYKYSASGGIPQLKKAICNYYYSRFGVDLEYQSESIVTIGAKEGITSLATAISEKNGYIAVPNPSYPIHTFAFIIAGSKAVSIDALDCFSFLQKFKEFIEKTEQKPTAVIINYPCNPTANSASLEFYEELVGLCRKYQIYIISDVAYCEIYFKEEDKPHSILEVKGAKELAIEFNSVSKSFSMAGCRVGFAVGNPTLIGALSKIKSYLDYGSFIPLQLAAIEALENNEKYLHNLRKTYYKRGETLCNLFKNELNWEIPSPKTTMFLWGKIPDHFNNNSFEFCKDMIQKAGVAFSPGSSFGSNGEGHVRISLIHDDEAMNKAVNQIKKSFY